MTITIDSFCSGLGSAAIQELGPCVRVQVARRFIGEKNLGIVDQRPSDGSALHFASRHLPRFVFQAMAEANEVEQLLGPCFEFFLLER